MFATSLGQYASPYSRDYIEKMAKAGGFNGVRDITTIKQEGLNYNDGPTESQAAAGWATLEAQTPREATSDKDTAVGSAGMYMAMLVQKKEDLDSSVQSLYDRYGVSGAEAKNIKITLDESGKAKVSGLKDASKAKELENALNTEKFGGYTVAGLIKDYQEAEKMGNKKFQDAFGKSYSDIEGSDQFEEFTGMTNFLSNWKTVNFSSHFKAQSEPSADDDKNVSANKDSSLSLDELRKKFAPRHISIEA